MKNYLRIAVSCILCLASAVSFSDWEGWGEVQKNFREQKSNDQKISYLRDHESDILIYGTEDLRTAVSDYKQKDSELRKNRLIQQIDAQLDSYVTSENTQSLPSAKEQIKKIKADITYKSKQELKQATWLQNLIERLKNLKPSNPPEMPDLKMPPWLATVLKVIFYLLCGLALVLVVWLISKIRVGKKIRSARMKGLLEEGEELLSEDEYVTKADQLAAEGRFREACRCLYLANLLHISAARIARFEPSETNWEHLRRIHASQSRPAGLEMRPITKLFDLIWYGDAFAGEPQFTEFKSNYLNTKKLIAESKAA